MELESQPLKKPFTFSQSSLQDYLDCPRRFQLKYILQVQWPAVEATPYLENERRQIEGQIFHRMVQQYYLGLPAEKISALASSENLTRWWNNFITHGPKLSDHEVNTEMALSARIGDHRLMAKYDLVAIKAKEPKGIFDWKTYLRKPSRARMAERMQTKVYSALLFYAGKQADTLAPFNPEKIKMTYWYAEFSESPEEFTFTGPMLEKEWKQIEQLIGEIASRQSFPMTEDERFCSVCPYRSLCERGTEAGAATDLDTISTTEFIDFDQIQEIEF